MHQLKYLIGKNLEPFVNCIMYDECQDSEATLKMPLYADGYPGIMYQESQNGFYLQPRGKRLSELFLYGQTIHPVSMESDGTYLFVVFQLYPFASKYLLNVDPRVLNDDCYDLLQLDHIDMSAYHSRIAVATSIEEKVQLISEVMLDLITYNRYPNYDAIQQSITIILQSDGLVKIKDILSQIHMSERTFERNFKSQVGLSPKQFAKIIQFQKSLSQLDESKFTKLTDVGIDSGFADQSHFIRTFKSYTGQTPSYYLQHSSL